MKQRKTPYPSGGSADQSHEDEVSSDETQTEELKLPKLDLVTTHVEKDRKVNKKTGAGAIPKTVKKQPMAKSAPNSNQSTPTTSRRATLMQDDILKKFLDETTNLSQKIDRTIEAWEASDGRASLGKRTAASLERMRGDVTLLGINTTPDPKPTWTDTMTADVYVMIYYILLFSTPWNSET